RYWEGQRCPSLPGYKKRRSEFRNIWSGDAPSKVSDTIDFVFRDQGEPWGADDDTDIEYMYQYLLDTHETSLLSPAQIREGWLRHIKAEEENYLWVSNQQAFDLMQKGMLPPATSDSAHNPHYDMIDAQLTTEIFGLFAPGRPDMALKMAELPIRTTADQSAAEIARFYVHMHALASSVAVDAPVKERLQAIALQARSSLSPEGYPIKMYDYVWQAYQEGWTWEATRDSVYEKYQVRQEDGYDITSQQLPCNGCFAAGINFAASLVSLFFGEGDLKETIKIGALAGWDSDNPTATWGGLIGFMLGKKGVEAAFGRTFSDTFFIHRTRQHFPNEGLDTFGNMAQTGIRIIDRVVREELKGAVTEDGKKWYVPQG
ncbi:MAG: ADP-ribosylglycohydrolase family protein, partial [Bacteroidota bacterium]